MKRFIRCSFAAVFVLLVHRGLSAQRVPASSCDSAATIVAAGHPSEANAWSYSAIRSCRNVGGVAFATGLVRYKTETDIAALEAFMSQLDNWTDAYVFDAVVGLATDTTATAQARVFAVRHLMYVLQPILLYTYAGLTRKADTTQTPDMMTWQEVGCTGNLISAPHGAIRGVPLPVDYQQRIRATLSSLATSSTTPIVVRYAAKCAQSNS